MSNISNYVNLTITRNSVGVARASFDVPAILAYPASWGASERSRSYTDIAGVTADFVIGTPENLAATAMFSQNPAPSKIKILRGTLKPTLLYAISVATVTNSQLYSINVVGPTYSGTASFTSDGTATNDEIAAGLVTALNNVAGNNYLAATTGSAGSLTITVTADNPGDWFSLELAVANYGDLRMQVTHADPGVATDLNAIRNVDSDWYALVTLYNSKAYVGAVATWMETQIGIYFADVVDTSIPTIAVASADDPAEDLFDLAYERSSTWWHPRPASMLAAAEVGRCIPLEPGSVNFANKTLSGVAAVSLTSTQRDHVTERNCNSYESVAGVGQTYTGTMAKTNQWIDVTRNLDWVRDDMTKSVFEALAENNIVPYTDEGVAIIEGKVRASLLRAANKGIADRATIVVTVPKVADAAGADKTARILRNVKFSFTLQGAVNKVFVVGTVSA